MLDQHKTKATAGSDDGVVAVVIAAAAGADDGGDAGVDGSDGWGATVQMLSESA